MPPKDISMAQMIFGDCGDIDEALLYYNKGVKLLDEALRDKFLEEFEYTTSSYGFMTNLFLIFFSHVSLSDELNHICQQLSMKEFSSPIVKIRNGIWQIF